MPQQQMTFALTYVDGVRLPPAWRNFLRDARGFADVDLMVRPGHPTRKAVLTIALPTDLGKLYGDLLQMMEDGVAEPTTPGVSVASVAEELRAVVNDRSPRLRRRRPSIVRPAYLKVEPGGAPQP